MNDSNPDAPKPADPAAEARAAHVGALQTELDGLNRVPTPNKRRVAEVQAELDKYTEKPAKRSRETATKG